MENKEYIYKPIDWINLEDVERLSFFSSNRSFMNSVEAANAIFNRDFADGFLKDGNINLDIRNYIAEIYQMILDTINVDDDSLIVETCRCQGIENVGKTIEVYGNVKLTYQENHDCKLKKVPLLPSEILPIVYRKENVELTKEYLIGPYSERVWDFKVTPFKDLKYAFYRICKKSSRCDTSFYYDSKLAIYLKEWMRKVEHLAQDFFQGMYDENADIVPKRYQIRMK